MENQDPINGANTPGDEPVQNAPSDVQAKIQNKLSGDEPEQKAHVGLPPELMNLSKEQLQAFKRMLDATPDQAPLDEENSKKYITLRRIGGKIVEDFNDKKGVYPRRVRNEVDREVEVNHIDIKFFDEEAYQPFIYKDFINSERVECEVLGIETKKRPVTVGKTIHRETGRPVDMVINYVSTTFNIRLPDGKEVRIDGKMANA